LKIDQDNCYIVEKSHVTAVDGWIIKINVPQYNNRNYIHCDLFGDLEKCIQARDDILKEKIGNWNTVIKQTGTYYRLVVKLNWDKVFGQEDKTLTFHSRKLNIIDVLHEWDLFTKNG